MELSYDLVKQFTYITNEKPEEKKKEHNVYGTVRKTNRGYAVQLDGSEEYTPIISATDIADGDRVGVKLQNHSACVLSNFTSPAVSNASFSSYKEEISGKFEEVYTNYLSAERADIKYATIQSLEATAGKIDTLSGDYLEYKKVVAGELEATTGRIDSLSGDYLDYKEIVAGDITAATARIDDLEVKTGKIDQLSGELAEYKKVVAGELEATTGRIDTLSGDLASYKTVIAGDLTAIDATITDLTAQDAKLTNLVAAKADIKDLEAVRTRTGALEADVADINTLVNGNLTSDNIQSLTLTSKNTTIENGMIKSAMIYSLAADKITGLDINTTKLTVHSDDGKSTWTDNTIQISDASRVRVQIGKDGSGDYTLAVWDKAGKLIWDALGATENTIQRKIIRDDVVADDAAIAGSKLDIPSVIKEVNGAQTKLSSTAINIDKKNQTLDVILDTMESTIGDNLDAAKLYADGQLSAAQKYALDQANSVLASAKGYTDALEIGGRNLLLQSATKKIKVFSGAKLTSQTGISVAEWGATDAIRAYGTGGTNIIFGVISGVSVSNTSVNGQSYVHSIYIKNNGSKPVTVSNNSLGQYQAVQPGAVVRLVIKGVGNGNNYLQFNFSTPAAGDTFDFIYWHPKVETGNRATDWTPAPEDTESEIQNLTEVTTTQATTISTMQGQISSLITADTTIKGDYNALVSQYNGTVATVNSLKTTIGQHTTLLDSQGKDILAVETKANTIETDLNGTKQTVSAVQTDLSGTKSRVSTVETGLDGLKTRVANSETAINKKADNSTVSTLTSRVATCETTLDGFETSLASTNKTVSDNYTNLKKYTDSAVAGIEIGGRNLFLKTGFPSNSALIANSSADFSKHIAYYNANSGVFESFDGVNRQITFTLTSTANIGIVFRRLASEIDLDPNSTYIMSAWVKVSVAGMKVARILSYYNTSNAWIWRGGTNEIAINKANTWTKIQLVFRPDADTKAISYGFTCNYGNNATMSIRHAKLEKGNRATDWSPAPEDTDAAIATHTEQISSHETRIAANEKGITLKVSSSDFNSYKSTVTTDIGTAKQAAITAAANDATTKANNALASAKTYADATPRYIYLESNYSQPIATLKNWATDGKDAGTWTVKSTSGVRVGDTVAIRCYNTDSKAYLYIIVKVTSVTSATVLRGISHGYIDPAAEDTAKAYTNGQISTVNTRLSTVDSSITTLQNQIKLKVEQKDIDEAAYSVLSGAKCLYKDVTFADGWNGVSSYNNSRGTGTVTITRQAKSSDNPYGNYQMMIQSYGTPSPGCGGFTWQNNSRANAIYLYKIIAKIPAGRKIIFASNPTGNGRIWEWLTPVDGTGKFQEYIFKLTCGASGTFSTTGFFYIDGTQGTSSAPVTWYLAYAGVWDLTAAIENLDKYSTTTQMQSAIELAKDNITSTVSETYATKNSLTNAEKRITTAETTITQHTKDISLRVKEADVNGNYLIGKINLSSTTATIEAKHIKLTGAVTVSALASDVTGKITTAQNTADTAKANAATAQSTANTAKSTADSALGYVTVKDTRNDNQTPQWYMQNHGYKIVREFKQCSKIGLSVSATYCTLETKVPWKDSSGGYPTQVATIGGGAECKVYKRIGTSNTAWGAWVSADQVIADWCYSNNKTYINGGKIYAKSITATQIDVANLFAQQITATGTITGLTLKGSKGEIGCWTISADRMYNATNTAGYTGVNKYGAGMAFWAGGTDLTGGSAPFRVSHNGSFVATNASITGSITATGGTIGGFSIGSNILQCVGMQIVSGSYTGYIHFASTTPGYTCSETRMDAQSFSLTGNGMLGSQAIEETQGGSGQVTTRVYGRKSYLSLGYTLQTNAYNTITLDGRNGMITCASVNAPTTTSVFNGIQAAGILCTGWEVGFSITGGGLMVGTQSITLRASQETHGANYATLGVWTGFWRWYPGADNSVVLGAGDRRWRGLCAANGTIATSDEREKDIIGKVDDRYLDFFTNVDPILYRWNYGDDRRIRVGIGAQTAERALNAAGLTLNDFAGISHDYFNHPTANGLTDRYGMDYDMYSLLAALQTKRNTKSISAIKSHTESLQYQLNDAFARIAQMSAEIAKLRAMVQAA